MHPRKRKSVKHLLVIGLVVLSLAVAQVPVGSQTSRVGNRQQRPSSNTPVRPQQPLPPLADKALEILRALRPEKGLPMADAFRKGKLPEPARLPQGNIDQQAAVLAKAVSAGDESSTAAFYAAILAAGYGVRDIDGSLLQTTERGQGIVLPASDVAATAKLYGEEYGVMLSHLSDAFVRNVPALKDIPLATMITDAIRTAANSNHPAVRFWGRFIVELSRNAPVPSDLLGKVDPKKTRLDAIQVSLILTRLTADLLVADKKTAQSRKPNYAHSPSKFVNVAKKDPDRLQAAQVPCKTTDAEDVAFDYVAIGATGLFGILANRVGGRFQNIGGLLSLANLVAVIFKFIASYAFLKVEFSMDAEYLVRTKDTQPGTFQTISAKLKIDDAPWQELKCWRTVLNAVGLDIELPENGPIKDVALQWHLAVGGNPEPILKQIEDAMHPDAYPDAITFLRAELGVDNNSLSRQRTDENGVSRIEVWGMPQSTDLSKRKVFELWKPAAVTVDVQLKTMKIRDLNAAMSTLGDIAGNVVSFFTEDLVGGGLGVVFETMYRSQWYSSKPFFFFVKDWEPCTGQWQGTITYSTSFEDKGSAENVVNIQSWDDQDHYDASIEITGEKDQFGAQWAVVKAKATKIRIRGSSGKGVCYRESKQVDYLSGSETVRSTGFSITVNSRTGEYHVSPPLPVVMGSGTYTVVSEVKGTCNNPYNKNLPAKPSPVTGIQLSAEGPTLDGVGRLDPNNPDVIEGTDTAVLPTSTGGQRKSTMHWKLTRCKD